MPRVSLVVPMYNVAAYVRACISSLLAQSFDDLEIVVVDDGSTDASRHIVADLATTDPRIRLIRRGHRGLGAARNVGVDYAVGELLMFVDSDDMLLPQAVETLVASLDQSGSDFATAVADRFDGVRRWRSGLFREPFNAHIRSVRISELPGLVFDTVAWNKLFQRTFWDDSGFRFPEGVYFEEIELVMRAYSIASVDVIPDVVYIWRERRDGTSITQHRTNPTALRDRMNALDATAENFELMGLSGPKRAFDLKVATLDLPMYARVFAAGGAEFRETFLDRMGAFLSRIDASVLAAVSRSERLLVDATIARDQRRVEAVADAIDGHGSLSALVAAHPPPARRRAAVVWTRMALSDVATVTVPVRRRMSGVLAGPGRAVGAISRFALERVVARSGDPTTVGAWSYRMTQRPKRVRQVLRGRPNTTIRRSVRILPGDVRVMVRYDARGHPRPHVSRPPVVVGWEVLGDSVVLLPRRGEPATLTAVALSTGRRVSLQHDDGGFFVPLAELLKGDEPSWAVEAVTPAGVLLAAGPIGLDGVVLPAIAHEVTVRTAPHGEMNLTVGRRTVAVTFATDSAGKVTLVAHVDHLDAPRLVLREPQAQLTIELDARRNGGELIADADLLSLRKYGERIALRSGRWAVVVIDAEGQTFPARLHGSLVPGVRRDVRAGVRYRYERSGVHLVVASDNDYRDEERGSFNQHLLTGHYETLRSRPATSPAVLYECYFGRSVGCHPRALLAGLQERLDARWKHLWVVEPGHQRAPPGTEPVVRWSRAYYDALASSGVVVTNSDLPAIFERTPHQVVVQTWHGTPLKKIGLDIKQVAFNDRRYQEQLLRQSVWWSLLVSPNPMSSMIFPAAFGYGGELTEVGSPRNDALVTDGSAVRATARSSLGVGPSTPVLLYAPTWRDTRHVRGGRYAEDVVLDLDRILETVPDLVVLLRAHTNISHVSLRTNHPRVSNVSDYPDVQDLIAAADLLVTDYSSVMFDFACTRRPMVFLCPDLETYRDDVRGFYFDFESTSPGPIVRSSEEVASLLPQLIAFGTDDAFAARYADFTNRYLCWEDGNATARVISRVLELVATAGHPTTGFAEAQS